MSSLCFPWFEKVARLVAVNAGANVEEKKAGVVQGLQKSKFPDSHCDSEFFYFLFFPFLPRVNGCGYQIKIKKVWHMSQAALGLSD
jgi:hypothetical protein